MDRTKFLLLDSNIHYPRIFVLSCNAMRNLSIYFLNHYSYFIRQCVPPLPGSLHEPVSWTIHEQDIKHVCCAFHGLPKFLLVAIVVIIPACLSKQRGLEPFSTAFARPLLIKKITANDIFKIRCPCPMRPSKAAHLQ